MNLYARRAIEFGLLVLLCSGAFVLAASGAQLSPPERIAKVTADLAALTPDVDRLRRELEQLPATATAPPAALVREVAGLRPHWQAVLEPLKGLPWALVQPVLPQAQALLKEIGSLERDLAAWKPAPRPTPPPHNVQTTSGTGAISGMVWDAATGQPMAHVMVTIVSSELYVYLNVETDANGNFLASGLEAGTYQAMVVGLADYIGEAYDGILCGSNCWYNGTPFTVNGGQTTTGIDFGLSHFASISGTVVDSISRLPLPDVEVDLFSSDEPSYRWAWTDGAGTFRFSTLVPGTYFALAGGGLFTRVLYDGIPCETECSPSSGTAITVNFGDVRNGIDFTLQRKGTISGTVTDITTGLGISGLDLDVYDPSGVYLTYTMTDADGHFTTPGLAAGTYFIRTYNWFGYADELYDGIDCSAGCDPSTGTPVPVTLGEDTGGVDFTLHRFGTFSGTVAERTSGTPLQDVYIAVVDSSGTYASSAYTDSSGHYTTGALAYGTYYAVAHDFPYLAQLFSDIPCYTTCTPTSGTAITVNLDADTAGIDFSLDLGGSLSGYVRSAVDNAPLQAAELTVYDTSGIYAASASTDATGHYIVQGLPPASYFVSALKWSAFAQLVYNGIPCDPSCDVTTGTPVNVTLAHETAGIDFSLPRRGSVSGTVTDAQTGLALGGKGLVFVNAEGVWSASASSDVTGHYSSPGLGAGTYFVVAADWSWPPAYITTLFQDIPCPDWSCDPTSGTPVTVTLGTETVGIDIAMPAYGAITGTVAESVTSAPLSGVQVALFDAAGAVVRDFWTSDDGAYSFVGLNTGTYFITTSNSSGYLNEVYDNIECEPSCTPTSGTPIPVTLGVTIQGVDVYLHRPFFADVPRDHWARAFIEALYADGVTAGCMTDPLRFCPSSWLLREQSAVLLLASKEGPAYQPPPAVGMFQDVPADSPYASWIEELANRGITAGCSVSPPLFCPEDPFTRRQAAVMLLATKEGQGYLPPPAIGMFQDVPIVDPFAPWIEELAHRGITAGCSVSPPLFCPDETVNRAQGAVFLVTTFALPPVR